MEEAQYKKSTVKNAISKIINEMGSKQHQKIKHNSSQYKKVGNIFKCGTCEKAEFFFKVYTITLNTFTTTNNTLN